MKPNPIYPPLPFPTVLGLALCVPLAFGQTAIAQSLMFDPEDLPEEILRTEIITEGRSPITGEPLSAQEYAELQRAIEERQISPQLAPEIQEVFLLLELRRFLKTLLPFF